MVPARSRESSPGRLRDREEEEERDGMQKRVNEYLQAAQEEGEKRQVYFNVLTTVCELIIHPLFSAVLYERHSLHGYKPGYDHTDRTIAYYNYEHAVHVI